MGEKITTIVDTPTGAKKIVKDVSKMSESELIRYAIEGSAAAARELARRRQ